MNVYTKKKSRAAKFEGILIFAQQELADMFDKKIFIYTEVDIVVPEGGKNQ